MSGWAFGPANPGGAPGNTTTTASPAFKGRVVVSVDVYSMIFSMRSVLGTLSKVLSIGG